MELNIKAVLCSVGGLHLPVVVFTSVAFLVIGSDRIDPTLMSHPQIHRHTPAGSSNLHHAFLMKESRRVPSRVSSRC